MSRSEISITAEAFVQEYLALTEEGWTPDLEEFLARVPDELREETSQSIVEALEERLCADLGPSEVAEAEEAEEATEFEELGQEVAASSVVGDETIIETSAEQFSELFEEEEPAPPAVQSTAAEFQEGIGDAPADEPEAEAEPEAEPEPEPEMFDLGALTPEPPAPAVVIARRTQPAETPEAPDETLEETVPDHPAADEPAGEGFEPVVPGYRIEQQLGFGTLGASWSAFDEIRSRRVVLKVLPEGARDAAGTVGYSVAQRVTGIGDPALVAFDGLAEGGDGPALVMEHIDGTPLDIAAAPLDLEGRVRLLLAAARALATAHLHGVAHLDLKPENILVTPGHNVKLIDFGLGASGAVAEGPFLSLEQALGRKGVPASDVFSFGAIAYAVLAGQLPFFGDTPEQLRESIGQTQPIYPRAIDADFPDDLQSLCLACLSHNPRSRPSPDEVVAELERFLTGEPGHVRPIRYATAMRERVQEHLDEIAGWQDQGLLTPNAAHRLESVYCRALADEESWSFDARRLPWKHALVYGGAVLLAASMTALVWFAGLAGIWSVLLPGLAFAGCAGVGAWAWMRQDRAVSAALLLGGALLALPVTLGILDASGALARAGSQSGWFARFSNVQLLAATGAVALLAGTALAIVRVSLFAWTAAFAFVAAYACGLGAFGLLERELPVQAAWFFPLALLAPAAAFLESRVLYRWADAFRRVGMVTLVAAPAAMCADGRLLDWLGFDATRAGLAQTHASVALVGLLLAGVAALLRRFGSLELRRNAPRVEWAGLAFLFGAFAHGACTQAAWGPPIWLAVAGAASLAAASWRRSRALCVAGLAALAVATLTPFVHDLVRAAPVALGTAFVAGLAAFGTYLYAMRR